MQKEKKKTGTEAEGYTPEQLSMHADTFMNINTLSHTQQLSFTAGVTSVLDDEWSERPGERSPVRLTDGAIDSGSHTYPIYNVTMLLFRPLNRPGVD